jgi:hypothetical protein
MKFLIRIKVGRLRKLELTRDKKLKILSLFLYIIVSCVFVYFVRPNYLLSIIIVLVPPSVTNFIWLKKSRKKVLVFSLSATFLFAFAVELSSRLSNSWDVQSVLPRIFGILPLENILFAFLNFFWVLSFYEYFIDKDLTKKVSRKFKYLIGIFGIFSLTIFSLYFYNPNIISMNYYVVAIITLIVPSLIIFSLNPRLLKKTFVPVVFFAVVFFIYEVVSLLIGSWWWPGEYLFPIKIFGEIFPLDDVIIWYFISTISLIGGYEFFVDDFK